MVETSTVEITREEYENLLRDRDILRALRGAGVDNWEGYDDAMSSFWEDN